jgi:hypothetical protein
MTAVTVPFAAGPDMAAAAVSFAGRRLVDTASLDPEPFAVDEGQCHFPSGGRHDPSKRLPGDIHPCGSFILTESFRVCQPKRFEFVKR